MHSFIISHPVPEVRARKLVELIARLCRETLTEKTTLAKLEGPFVNIIRPDPSISIGRIRDLKSKLRLRPPRGVAKIAAILQAESLTLPAQHAILKTLEEPTPNTFLFLETQNPYSLLPTIRSRCQLVRISPTPVKKADSAKSQAESLFKSLCEATPGTRIQLLKGITSREQAQEILIDFLRILRGKMVTSPNLKQGLKATQEALLALEANVNLKLVLETLALRLPISKSSRLG